MSYQLYANYINGEEWRKLRREKLIQRASTCELCWQPDVRNDVHHVWYRNLYDCSTGDLRVLCRQCHDLVHRMLKAYPSIKKMPTPELSWGQLIKHVDRHVFGPRDWNPKKWRRQSSY